jgi:hypothetical protein
MVERKQIMRKVIALIGVGNIEAILADREFIGHEWFKFLYEWGLPFIIRIKDNAHVVYDCGGKTQVRTIMRNVWARRRKESLVTIRGIPIIKLVGTRSVDGALVVVAASRSISGDVLTRYNTRWLIELCFKSIKSKGFNLEETHMTDPERISKLFTISAIACLLVVKAGKIRALFKKIPVKNHGRPLYSVFTYGLDLLRIVFSSYFDGRENPPIYHKVLGMLFMQNIEKTPVSGDKNVGY